MGYGRGRARGRPRGRGRSGRGQGRQTGGGRSRFKTSRVEETKDSSITSSADETDSLLEEDHTVEDISEEGSESERDTGDSTSSYGQLLRSLSALPKDDAAPRKRRKLNGSDNPVGESVEADFVDQQSQERLAAPQRSPRVADMDVAESEERAEEYEEEEGGDGDSVVPEEADEQNADSDAEEDLIDPFESHFANPDSSLTDRLKAARRGEWKSESKDVAGNRRKSYSVPATCPTSELSGPHCQALEDLKLKRRLVTNGAKVWDEIEPVEREIATPIFTYRDVLFGCRSVDNAAHLRELTVLHALNHVLKTRDRVIKNNSRLAQDDPGDTSEIRDQGFTRPKILFILPTRRACVRFVESLVKICDAEQQENKSRFTDEFAQEDDETPFKDKPIDFQELFGGNHDDMFRIGLKLTRKTVKFFSAFYNSDIIFASPLGLRTAIETGGSKNSRKGPDADFLSSIEVVIVDHANALLMQNWQHVEFIFSQLNLLPKESHGCDFSRVRHWYLDGDAKQLRQTIVFTDFITPEINSLYTRHMLNLSGRIKYTPIYKGAMLATSASLPIGITQTFSRLTTSSPSPSPSLTSDVRFSTFISTILPSITTTKSKPSATTGTLIFTSSYADFLRLRNHLSTSPTTSSLSFGAISEYTSVRDVARARSYFLSGRHSVLLYSERAHHFRRYLLKGVRRVVFYSLPENPLFWGEVVGMLAADGGGDRGEKRRGVRALFSRWDVLKLERIVGSERVRRMVDEKGKEGDVFEFT